jgi:cold shock protein
MPKNDNVVQLHDYITVTFSPKVSKLIRAEMERQVREGWRQDTIEEIVEYAVTFHCKAMATKIIDVMRGKPERRNSMPTGKLAWFNGEMGYGFIQCDDGGRDVFLHADIVNQADIARLDRGEVLHFEMEVDGTGRRRATSIWRIMDGVAA